MIILIITAVRCQKHSHRRIAQQILVCATKFVEMCSACRVLQKLAGPFLPALAALTLLGNVLREEILVPGPLTLLHRKQRLVQAHCITSDL